MDLRIASYDLAHARPAVALTPVQEGQLDALHQAQGRGEVVMRVASLGGELVAHVLVLLRITDEVGELVTSWNQDRAELARGLAATRSALLTDLLVMEGHRRRGVARALVLDALEQARAAGAARLTLYVGPENLAAIRLYETLGFTRSDGSEVARLEYVRDF